MGIIKNHILQREQKYCIFTISGNMFGLQNINRKEKKAQLPLPNKESGYEDIQFWVDGGSLHK